MYENEKTIYVVMEYLEGKKLHEVIKEKTEREGHFTEAEAKHILKNILESISY
jgi:serine/threonine protein kinase